MYTFGILEQSKVFYDLKYDYAIYFSFKVLFKSQNKLGYSFIGVQLLLGK